MKNKGIDKRSKEIGGRTTIGLHDLTEEDVKLVRGFILPVSDIL
jgi:hypothetical protein